MATRYERRRSHQTRSAACWAITPLTKNTAAGLPSSSATSLSRRPTAPPSPYRSHSSTPSSVAASDSSRRVALVTHTPRSFDAAKHPAITTIKIEPVAGIGDEAFYQIYPGDSPTFIWVRKGNAVISIRIITRLKPMPFTIEQEKAKEAALAKAAVAKL